MSDVDVGRPSSEGAGIVSPRATDAPWPEPLRLAAYHGLAGEVVSAIYPHTEADLAALLVQLLVAFGNAIGRGPYFEVEGDRHATNLFAVIVGATSKARKGTSWGRIRRLFEDADPTWVGERVATGLSSGEGLIWAVRDPIDRLERIKEKGKQARHEMVVVDPGVADKRLLAIEEEFASTLRVMGRDGNTLSAVIRQAWDGGDLRALTKNSPARATGALISIVGHVTADELRRYLDRTEAGNGFANRFLLVCARRSKALPEGGSLPDERLRLLAERLARALAFARGVGALRRDDEARRLWAEVYLELSEGRPGLLGAVISRAEAQVLRLAMLYALLDETGIIRVCHLRAALAVWAYCEASARHVFGGALGDPVADEILRALKASPGGLSRAEISNLFSRNKDAATIGRALGALLAVGAAGVERRETGGRPVEWWIALG